MNKIGDIFSLETAEHSFEIVYIDNDEPNNGRMLRVVSFYIDDEDVTKKYFKSWNKLNWELEHFQFNSKNNRYVFLPKETTPFLVDTVTLKKHDLKSIELSTVHFIGNIFYDSFLIIISQKEIHMVELTSLSTRTLTVDENETIKWAEIRQQNQLIVYYLDADNNSMVKSHFIN